MNKRILVVLLSLMGIFLCHPVISQDKEIRRIIKKAENIPPFDSIKLTGMGNLYITQADKQSFTLEAEEKILQIIQMSVNGSTLFIELKPTETVQVEEGTKINYHLNIKELKNIELSGSTGIFINEGLTSKELTLKIDSPKDSKLKLTVDKFNANLTGGGIISAEGTATTQEIFVGSATTYNGTKLIGQNGRVEIRGAGTALTNINENLNIEIAGLGEVHYCGKPNITKKISGTGSITQLTEKECQGNPP